jgi:hypothetical protein
MASRGEAVSSSVHGGQGVGHPLAVAGIISMGGLRPEDVVPSIRIKVVLPGCALGNRRLLSEDSSHIKMVFLKPVLISLA